MMKFIIILFPDLFSDEPPPLEEDEISKPIKTGLFSGGQGLFDDDEDEADNFWNPNPKQSISNKIKGKTVITFEYSSVIYFFL